MGYRSYRGFSLNAVWVIITVNFAVFIVTLMLGNVYITYGDVPIGVTYRVNYYLGLIPFIFTERPWTLITSMFAHGGFWHIFANMLTFYFFGSFLSRLVGQKKFLLVYFGGGIAGNAVYLLAHMSSQIPLVGASGAIFALAGALVLMVPKLRVFIFPIPAPMPLWLAVIGVFVVLTVLAVPLHIAWEAHLGGLMAGFIAGYFFRKKGRYYY
jgi:membrane associated rhomboid family serine protease